MQIDGPVQYVIKESPSNVGVFICGRKFILMWLLDVEVCDFLVAVGLPLVSLFDRNCVEVVFCCDWIVFDQFCNNWPFNNESEVLTVLNCVLSLREGTEIAINLWVFFGHLY